MENNRSDLPNKMSIPDSDGYFIDQSGNITNSKGKSIATRPDKDGYAITEIRQNGKKRTCKVHQLVLLAFIGPTPVGMETNHINKNRSDNRLENLEYLTHQDNVIHSYADGTRKNAKGNRNGSCTIRDEVVPLIQDDLRNGYTYRQIMNKYHTSKGSVNYVKYHR